MDIGGNGLVSLEEISLNYELILVDSCSFQGVFKDLPELVADELGNYLIQKKLLKPSERDLNYLEKIKNYLIKKKSFDFFVENLKDYENCYTIPEVVQEIKNARGYDYKEKIKQKNSKKNLHLPKLRRSIRDSNMSRNRLIRFFEDGQRILKLDEKEKYLYNKFYGKYKRFEKYYSLHGADLPLLVSGAVIAYARDSSAIISNDSKIGSAWKSFLKEEGLLRRRFEFFTRQDISAFEKWRDRRK